MKLGKTEHAKENTSHMEKITTPAVNADGLLGAVNDIAPLRDAPGVFNGSFIDQELDSGCLEG